MLTADGICSFCQLICILRVVGGKPSLLRSRKLLMTMKCLLDFKYLREAWNPKLTELIWSVKYGSSKSKNAQMACFLEMQNLDILASQDSILKSEISPEILDRYLKDWLFCRRICEMLKKNWSLKYRTAINCKLGHVTSPNLLADVMSSISRHWPLILRKVCTLN